jgi:hypothetical protein
MLVWGTGSSYSIKFGVMTLLLQVLKVTVIHYRSDKNGDEKNENTVLVV